jgi:competence protein ComEC
LSRGRIAVLYGTVAADQSPATGSGERFTLRIESVESPSGDRADGMGYIEVTTPLPERLRRGMRIRCPIGKMSMPGIAHVREEPEIIGWRNPWEKLRARGFEFIEKRIRSIGHPSSGLLSALLLGVRESSIGPLIDLFRRAGAVHLLALSGMHLGFLFLLIAGLCIPLLGKRTGLLITFAVILFYLSFVGARPSLLRAVLMSGLGILWSLSPSGKIDMLRVLVLSFIIHAALLPGDAYSLSFGLSYLALLGILSSSRAIERRLPFFLPPKSRSLLAAGIAAQLFSAPLLLSTFGELFPAGIVSSLVLTPPVMVLMALGLFYLAVFPVFFFLHPPQVFAAEFFFRRLLEMISRAIERSAAAFAELPALRSAPGEEARMVVLWCLLLTLAVLLHYAGMGFRLKRRMHAPAGESRFACTDRTISAEGGIGSVTPLWAELPYKSGDTGEDPPAPRSAGGEVYLGDRSRFGSDE